ncbi:tetratricopeptide repeat protein [Flavobacterium sp. RNTU_13]|uniref:tetratricopeptide repeat protein n=1 Tax=Flavobacterium sp. RNTU_13 TaxID=3375145 RepID=UPI00398824E7
MKPLLLFIATFLFSVHMAYGQKDGLYFDKKYYECENKWVALPQKEVENTYIYGFVYLDGSAGYTFDVQGNFSVNSGKFSKDNTQRESSLKYRLPKRYALLAILPDIALKQMGLPKEPDWLKIYREGEDNTDRLVNKGFLLNDVEASAEAIPVLLKAYGKDPHYKGLEFELAFAYNATEQYTTAIEVLKKALSVDPENYMFYRELGYSYLHNQNAAEAEKLYTKGISISKDDDQSAEMAFNMAGHYYGLKDKVNFAKWAATAKKYMKDTSPFKPYLEKMETELK